MKKITFSIFLIFLIQIHLSAQNEVDALRFSEVDWQGTARFMGAGRAFGAVGAEFSALNMNPATIGLYKKSEVTFTPLTISINKSNSGYNETATPAQTVKYNLNSAGLVFAIPGVQNSLWKKFQIGFGYNRIKNYNNTFSIEGRSKGSSIGYAYANYAEGLDYRDIQNYDIWSDEMWMAWEYYLIDPKPDSYTSYNPSLAGMNLFQSSTVTHKGGNDEMLFSFGTNYDDKLFLGATLGVPFIHFTENRTYLEKNDKEPSHHFQQWSIEDNLSVRSSGINLKLGVIYQPFDFLRVGVAFHTPTYYGNVKDSFIRNVFARKWDYADSLLSKKTYDEHTEYRNNFNYSLTTPLRVMVNAAFFIQQRAFISAEYEFADYSMSNMYSVSYNFSEENRAIQKKYGGCHIARIGAEINLTQVFAVRAGYNYISSPYKNNINDGSKHYVSAGFGFRTKYLYGDFAYAITTSKENYWMYNPEYVNVVNQRFNAHRIMLTLGVRF
jgi:hypothetical protein